MYYKSNITPFKFILNLYSENITLQYTANIIPFKNRYSENVQRDFEIVPALFQNPNLLVHILKQHSAISKQARGFKMTRFFEKAQRHTNTYSIQILVYFTLYFK